MASTYLSRTNGTATGTQKYTLAFWYKRSAFESEHRLFNNHADDNNKGLVRIDSSNKQLHVRDYASGSQQLLVTTNRKFRDPGAFYHICVVVDTTQGTQADRCKVYVNGVQETDLATATYPSQNANLAFQQATASGQARIGTHNGGNGDFLDGILAHVHYVDGLAYAPTTFGEFDSTSGIWVPKTAPSVTYGNNGYFLKFENSAAMGTDSSGNSNTYTVNGTMTQNNDTPTNLFMTFNPLDGKPFLNTTFSNANNTIATGSSYTGTNCNMWLTQSKWYWEIKCVSKTGDNDHYSIGIDGGDPASATNQYPAASSKSWMIDGHTGNVFNNNSGTSYGATFGAGDIIGIALDLTNNKLYFSKNGTWQNSGVPTSGSTGTGAVSITAAASTDIRCYIPCATFWSSSSGTFDLNAGGGFFGTTAVASANADANGNGAMEYAVPSGYYTLCTKNIKEYGI